MRAWKEHQRAAVGGRVPLVRCLLHDKVLNLGVGGDVFESDLAWERGFPDSLLPLLDIPMPPPPDPAERLRRAEQWTGLPAPDFTLPGLDGDTVSLSGHRGRDVVVLDFWATWCGPCVRLFPQLVALEQEFRGKPVVFYSVNLAEPPDKVRRFLGERGFDLHVLLETAGATARAYEVSGIPRTIVIGKDGLVKGVRVGYAADFSERTRRDIETALRGD
jgi:thiol-disulfide isomerase/thioredoxin